MVGFAAKKRTIGIIAFWCQKKDKRNGEFWRQKKTKGKMEFWNFGILEFWRQKPTITLVLFLALRSNNSDRFLWNFGAKKKRKEQKGCFCLAQRNVGRFGAKKRDKNPKKSHIFGGKNANSIYHNQIQPISKTLSRLKLGGIWRQKRIERV